MISRRLWFSMSAASALGVLGLVAGCTNSDVAVATSGPGAEEFGDLPTGPPQGTPEQIKQRKAAPRGGGSPNVSPQQYSK